jgi:hypothetical protein
MADYLSTNTARLRVTQIGPRGTHKMQFRFMDVTPDADMVGEARLICAALKAITFVGVEWIAAEKAVEGSDVFLPVEWGSSIVSTGAISESNIEPYGTYLNFLGRSVAGSRLAFYLYNVPAIYLTKNNRLTTSEEANVGTIIGVFNAASPVMVGIDQNAFVMKNYANSGINDRVAKKSRALA